MKKLLITAEDVLEALRLWPGGDPAQWPLAQMRLNFLAAEEQSAYGSLAEAGPAARNRAVLSRGLEVLRGRDSEAHDLLRQRFEHQRDVMELANRLNVTKSGLLYRQRQAVNQLTDILLLLETQASLDWQEKMTARLGLPSYEKLVGVAAPRTTLLEALLDEDSHFIAALDGLGGMGKTALADQIVRDLIQTTRFDEICWVTAKQTHLSAMGRLQVESGRPALTFPMLIDELAEQFDLLESTSQLQRQRLVRDYLRESACLVVIDNLETVADYRALLPELQRWQQPSKFLLTSRRRLLDEAGIFSLSLRELSLEAARQLMLLEARRIGFNEMEYAGQETLHRIYEAVGGNPMALKIMMGQLRFHSLPEVLERFSAGRQAHGHDGLFDYIYREAWEGLNDIGKETLLTLTQAGETGFSFSHLASMVSFSQDTLADCLEELILLSLVDMAGSLTDRRYRLHRLTELFLLRTFEEG